MAEVDQLLEVIRKLRTIQPQPIMETLLDASTLVFLYDVRFHQVSVIVQGAEPPGWLSYDADQPGPPPLTLNALIMPNNRRDGHYYVDRALGHVSTLPVSRSQADFGITLVMYYFAKFYAHSQYAKFAMMFQPVDELKILERFLAEEQGSRRRLPYELAFTRGYGLRDVKYTEKGSLTVGMFTELTMFLYQPACTRDTFVARMKPLHVRIVESFYTFTSFTRNCKEIHEGLSSGQYDCSYPYTFEPAAEVRHIDDIRYWFVVPTKATWFAYSNRIFKLRTYTPAATRLSVVLDPIPHSLVVGFLVGDAVFPLRIDPPDDIDASRNPWDYTVEVLKKHGLPVALSMGPLPAKRNTRTYCVCSDSTVFFRVPS